MNSRLVSRPDSASGSAVESCVLDKCKNTLSSQPTVGEGLIIKDRDFETLLFFQQIFCILIFTTFPLLEMSYTLTTGRKQDEQAVCNHNHVQLSAPTGAGLDFHMKTLSRQKQTACLLNINLGDTKSWIMKTNIYGLGLDCSITRSWLLKYLVLTWSRMFLKTSSLSLDSV